MHLLSCLVLSLSAAPLQDSKPPAWGGFRGPGGLAQGGDVAHDLAQLRRDEDLSWKVRVPKGSSSPCIVGDRMVLTGAVGTRLAVFALALEDGALLWQRSFDGDAPPEYAHVDALLANPTPCSDGARVFAYFGTYGLVALDLDGQVLWERRMKHPASDFGVGASPILAGGHLIVPRDGADEAAILALDPASGEEVYRIDRSGFYNSHATPFLWRNSEREELVLTGTRQLRSHDPESGELLWTVQDVTIFTCTTPTAHGDRLFYAGWSTPNADARGLLEAAFNPPFELTEADYADLAPRFTVLDVDGDGVLTMDEIPAGRAKDAFPVIDADGSGVWEREEFTALGQALGAPGKNVALCVRAGGSGDVTDTHVEWRWTRGIPYVSSPLFHRDRIWLVKAGGIVTTLDADTGRRRIDRERLPVAGEYYMSPLAMGDHVLVGSVAGELYVLAASDEFDVVNTLDFEDPVFATPAVAGGRLFVRTNQAVWCY